jgi:hypothetical protein|tara:strand:+ start:556 stop:879 length:324 start_codon:yes stop_codon:yes gene_type:complete
MLVVQSLGLITGHACQPRDRVTMHADEPTTLTNAAAFMQVLQHGQTLLVGQLAIEQRRALAFAEPGLAGATIEQANVVVFAKPPAHGKVFQPALAVVETGRIETAEP